MAAWLTDPVQLTGSRSFMCDDSGFTPEQCEYYMQRWHFWYIADYVYALPTVALFMTGLGIFIIGHFISSQLLGYRKFRGPRIWRKSVATIRYLSYRGFYMESIRWHSAPIGVLLLGFAGTIYFFCMDLIPQPYYWASLSFGGSPPLGTRSGWMALACMPFVFATASKTNWITLLTGVSHERLQVFHRWIAYAFFILALMHTFPFIVYHIHFHDMTAQVTTENTLVYWTGIVAIIFQAWLTFASHSMIRKLNYEFFKAAHLLAVVVFVLIFFWHCNYTLTSWHYFIATAAVYVPCYVYPWLRTCFEHGRRRAYLSVEMNDFVRISIPSVDMKWKPGQHCFLRFTSFGLQALSSHPFTICSLPSWDPKEKSELVFYVRHRDGLTKKLLKHAQDHPVTGVPVLIDGPYGGINMQRYIEADQLLVVAGGSGAGWILPFIELFVRRICATAGTQEESEHKEAQPFRDWQERHLSGEVSLHVVLATRHISTYQWFLGAVGDILRAYPALNSTPAISMQVHLTDEAQQEAQAPKGMSAVNITSASTTSSEDVNGKMPLDKEVLIQSALPAQWSCGRPDLPRIVHDEGVQAAADSHSLSVYVCGPTTMLHDVQNAVAQENLHIMNGSTSDGVYLHTEHFSWA